MKKSIIGTHDSATGEKGRGLLSKIVTPFAKTQRLDIRQQFHNGCRYFDIRLKFVDGAWHCGHGLWTSSKTAFHILSEINELAKDTTDDVFVCLTYEGKMDKYYHSFEDYTDALVRMFSTIKFESVNVKLPVWKTIKAYNSTNLPMNHLFKTLDYSSWHTYFPCPMFWNIFYRSEPKDGCVNLYDFL